MLVEFVVILGRFFTTVFNIFVWNVDKKRDSAREATARGKSLDDARSEVQSSKKSRGKPNETVPPAPPLRR